MKGQLRLSASGKRLLSPSGFEARPTSSIVREAIMNIFAQSIQDSSWLDVFSGSGVIGCEALSKGAKKVLAIEKNRKTYEVSKTNLNSFHFSNNPKKEIAVVHGNALTILKKGLEAQKSVFFTRQEDKEDYRFNFVYLDPPYQSGLYHLALENLVLGNWIKPDATVICEYSIQQKFYPTREWSIRRERYYGKTGLMFLRLNQPNYSHVDTDSKH